MFQVMYKTYVALGYRSYRGYVTSLHDVSNFESPKRTVFYPVYFIFSVLDWELRHALSARLKCVTLR